MPQFTQIECAVAERVMTITLNRPDRLNAYTAVMREEIIGAIDDADRDDTVRAVVFTGAGRGFCAGADMAAGTDTFSRASQFDAADPNINRDGGGLIALRLFDFKKPLIAAINGPAAGIGITMTLPMDIRIASTTAKFVMPFARRGIVPEACSSWFLPRIVGISQALRWAYSGHPFDADEALAGGLVSEVVDSGALLARAYAIAKDITDGTAPVSVALTRQMFWKMLGADHPMAAHRLESAAIAALGQAPDAREGVLAFIEKRPPSFIGTPSRNMPEMYPWWKPQSFE
jgi:enoyl-CoA hydratase/carnithine racemase